MIVLRPVWIHPRRRSTWRVLVTALREIPDPAGKLGLGDRQGDPYPTLDGFSIAVGEIHQPPGHPADAVVGDQLEPPAVGVDQMPRHPLQ